MLTMSSDGRPKANEAQNHGGPMIVEPITCLRPTPESVSEFAALPYDVFTEEEARAYVSQHPKSFLAIDRPETGFPPGTDPTSQEVYDHARELVRERQLDSTLVRDEKPCFYVYELTSGAHRQTGLMGAVSVDEYLDGTLRRHELTLARKEEDRVRHIKTTRAQTGPVFLAYRDNMAVSTIIEAACMSEPLYDFTSPDGVRQRVWRIARPVAVEAISVGFTTVDGAYIADGHHRAAAAVRICEERREQGRVDDPSSSFLAVLFPKSQLRILPYNRIVADRNGMDTTDLVSKVEAAGFSCSEVGETPFVPNARREFGMYTDGRWYKIAWNGELDDDDPVSSLDVSILQDNVLAPLLDVQDPRTDKRISFVGGADAHEVAAKVPGDGVGFLLYPTSLDDLMAVADANELMPPKSTWFDPKLLSGLALRRIW